MTAVSVEGTKGVICTHIKGYPVNMAGTWGELKDKIAGEAFCIFWCVLGLLKYFVLS